jgi:hypothetical protein
VEDVNKAVNQCRNLIANGKQFAVLLPVSIAGEMARLENSGGDRHNDGELLKKVEGSSRIILAQDAEMWLLNLINHRINEFVPVHQQWTNEARSQETIQWAFDRFKNNKANQLILGDNDYTNVADTDSSSCPVMLPTTRSQRNIVGEKDSRAQPNGDSGGDSSIHTPAAGLVIGESQGGPTSDSQIIPVIREREESDGQSSSSSKGCQGMGWQAT